MASESEMIADIIAEMRMGNAGDFPFAYMIGDTDTPEVVDITTKAVIEPRKINIRRVTISNLADRLESAWKREKRGNAAAMREALELCVEAMCRYCRAEARACDLPQCLDGCETLKIAKAALAKPSRNCDMPHANDHELWLRWQNYCAEIWPRSISFSSWLIAPAERKGGRDVR